MRGTDKIGRKIQTSLMIDGKRGIVELYVNGVFVADNGFKVGNTASIITARNQLFEENGVKIEGI